MISFEFWSPIPECNNLNGEKLMCYTELVTPPVVANIYTCTCTRPHPLYHARTPAPPQHATLPQGDTLMITYYRRVSRGLGGPKGPAPPLTNSWTRHCTSGVVNKNPKI